MRVGARQIAAIAACVVLTGACRTTPAPPPVKMIQVRPAPLEPAGYERPPVLCAEEFLPAELIEGPLHRVADRAVNDGYMNHYLVVSEFGTWRAAGRNGVEERIREIQSIALLREMRMARAMKLGLRHGARDVVMRPFRDVRRYVRNPFYLIRAVPEEIGDALSILDNVQVVFEYGLSHRALKEWVGFYSARRRFAGSFGIDTAARNTILQWELENAAWAYFAAQAPLRLAEDGLPGIDYPEWRIGTGRGRLGEVVEMIVEESQGGPLRRQLRAAGVSRETRRAFGGQQEFTERDRRRIAALLVVAEGVENRDGFVQRISASTGQARYAIFEAEMLAAFHVEVEPIARVIATADFALCETASGKRVTFFPFEYVPWTLAFAKRIDMFARDTFEIGPIEIWIAGRFSERARSEVAVRGFAVVEDAWDALARPSEESSENP